jgi:hypothetical protein
MRPETKGFLVSLALALACACAFIAVNGCSDASGRAIPHRGPKPPCLVWLPVTGKSMLPKYPEAHLLEVDVTFDYDRLAVGDEVVFWDYRRDGGVHFTFHPIIGRQGDYYITRGLNPATNPRPDAAWVTRDNFIGKATGRSTLILFAPKP